MIILATMTRDKIKPEDFLNESAFRSRGSSLEKGAEPNIVTNADAKLAKFFGFGKKTPDSANRKSDSQRRIALKRAETPLFSTITPKTIIEYHPTKETPPNRLKMRFVISG